MSTAVGVLIVDEPNGLDASFRATLEHAPDLRTLGEEEIGHADAGQTVVVVFVRNALVDVTCERIASLHELHPPARILVIFQALGSDDLRRLIAAGANAFIGRGAPMLDLHNAILALAAGSDLPVEPINAEVQAAMAAEMPESLTLTPREAEVLRFLSAGYSNKEVARRLSLSVRTVETHRLNLRRKTQTGRLKDLVTLARQLGLDPVLDADMPRRVIPH